MPTSFDVASSIRSYRVSIGAGLFGDLLHRRPEDVILCDTYFVPIFNGRTNPVVAVPASEDAKSLDRIVAVIERLREAGCNRQSSVVAIGGGVIQDIATFCASIYMRGVDWRYAPTTLLGMVDSCIGGKSAINVGKYKNIVGNFYPPCEVVVDPSLADTLLLDQKIAGLCEAAKICFAGGAKIFDQYLALVPGPDMSVDRLERVIELSLATKKAIIELDEFDRKERLLLNFGHTFGHAIEGASGFSISHGVAVGLGILASVRFAETAGLLSLTPKRTARLAEHLRDLLVRVPGLSECCKTVDPAQAFDRFLSDKKHKTSEITLVLSTSRGDLELRALPRSDHMLSQVAEAFQYVQQGLTLSSSREAVGGSGVKD